MCVCVQLRSIFATPWTVAPQAFVSLGFFQQEYWSGVPFPPPWGLPNPRIEPASRVPPALGDRFFTWEPPGSQLSSYVSSAPHIKTESVCSSRLDVCPESCSTADYWTLLRHSSSPRAHLPAPDFCFGLLHLSFQSPSKRTHLFLLLTLQRKDDLLSNKPYFWVLPATTNYYSSK